MRPVSRQVLASRLRAARKAAGFSRQADLAAFLGAAQATVSGWECGRFKPSDRIWEAIAHACRTSVEALFFEPVPTRFDVNAIRLADRAVTSELA
jgi:transcriptional regulator with XRE-family HTH domain